ncbi:MAG TPA: site-specific integrase [Rhizomicrobium sp.]|jgi:integrase|nr:site-specific integrase [Rhizomicrobium sp.]
MSMVSAPAIPMPLPSAASGSLCPTQPATLADVADFVRADESLSPARRREILSALATVARALGRDLEDIPAHVGFIREQLKGFTPSMLKPCVTIGKPSMRKPHISIGRWRNVQCYMRAAFELAGIPTSPGRYRPALTPAWEKLLAKLDPMKRFNVFRFAQFCTAEQIAPEEVNDEVLARFHAYLNQALTNGVPREIHRTACKVWNVAVERIEGWPHRTVKVPDYRRRYSVPLDQFAPQFISDMDAYLARLRPQDILDDEADDIKPWRPISIKTIRLELHQFASALVHRGRDPKTLTALADLIEVATVKEGLRFFYEERTPGKHLRAHRMASNLLPIAKYWVKAPPEHIKKLQTICSRLNTKPEGMTSKNVKILGPFDDRQIVDTFLNLPSRMLEEVAEAEEAIARGKRSPRSRHTGRSLNTPRQRALLFQTAVAVEILIMAPLRMANLGSIQIGVHLLTTSEGYRLQFEEEEVKNGQRLGPPLPAPSSEIFREYIQHHRKHLSSRPSTFLFPGTKESQKCLAVLAGHITRAAKEYGGITLTPHLFRHIAAKLHLKANPGDFGTVQKFLGHKDIRTTMRIYCEFMQPAAFERYDEHVLKLRQASRDGQSGDTKPPKRGR